MSTLAVDAIGPAVQTSPSRGMEALRSEDFFQILVTELKQQDPLQPSDTSDMIGQVSQIRDIELSQQLTKALGRLSSQQQVGGASELIGKHVTATVEARDGSQTFISGLVTGVRFDGSGNAVLELDTGEAVLASDVTYITSAEAAAISADPAEGEESGEDENQQDKDAAAQKVRQDAERPNRLLPWLALDGIFRL